jgi:hypothetical protein
MVEINDVFQVHTLEAWQGSYGTGTGYMATPRRKKEEEEETSPKPKRADKGVTKDDSGVVHVDLIA